MLRDSRSVQPLEVQDTGWWCMLAVCTGKVDNDIKRQKTCLRHMHKVGTGMSENDTTLARPARPIAAAVTTRFSLTKATPLHTQLCSYPLASCLALYVWQKLRISQSPCERALHTARAPVAHRRKSTDVCEKETDDGIDHDCDVGKGQTDDARSFEATRLDRNHAWLTCTKNRKKMAK